MQLTVAYITSRKNPRVEWFLQSLYRQIRQQADNFRVNIIIVTHHPMPEQPIVDCNPIAVMRPMPNPYHGPMRLTKRDSFCPAVNRNTALCATTTEWIAYVDDLSVLMPGWLNAVRSAMQQNHITFGAYKKVKELVVQNGEAVSYKEFPQGVDNRLAHVNGVPIQCGGEWLYGCSLVIPVEALLSVGGFASDLSGTMGFEDCLTGIALQNAGYSFWYDGKMLTLESEEAHFEEEPFFKTDKGVSPNDKSHKALAMVREGGMKYFENSLPGGLREMRRRFLAGEPFPTDVNPRHCWYDGQSLSEMG